MHGSDVAVHIFFICSTLDCLETAGLEDEMEVHIDSTNNVSANNTELSNHRNNVLMSFAAFYCNMQELAHARAYQVARLTDSNSNWRTHSNIIETDSSDMSRRINKKHATIDNQTLHTPSLRKNTTNEHVSNQVEIVDNCSEDGANATVAPQLSSDNQDDPIMYQLTDDADELSLSLHD
jgi:hypothetical protein